MKRIISILAVVLVSALACNYEETDLAFENTTDLTEHDFSGQYLVQANFANKDLRGANFEEADLEGADFSNSDCRGASFDSAYLIHANFSGAQLDEKWSRILPLITTANAVDQDYSRQDLSNLDVENGTFRAADFSGSDLSHSNFTGGDFSRADLSGTNLDNTDFSFATLHGAVVDPDELSKAYLFCTQLPDGRIELIENCSEAQLQEWGVPLPE